jgi:hypothetical protein
MTNKENCRYAVLSAVHDEGVSVGDAVDELYDHHMRPMEQQIVEKDAESGL